MSKPTYSVFFKPVREHDRFKSKTERFIMAWQDVVLNTLAYGRAVLKQPTPCAMHVTSILTCA
jgi:hypothetical protein